MRGEDGKFALPERTLGWQIAGWVSEYILNPRSQIDDPQPFRFTNEQMRLLLWWYAVDERGRFVYRTGIIQRIKGWGKDPFLAVISLIELVGPSRFKEFLSDGTPLGEPHPAGWVQVVATSQSQPLALDTRVRTTAGWTTMGNVAVGDYVYDEHGTPQLVARETEVLYGKDCYRITFDDGQQVVASANHGWTLQERSRHDRNYRQVTVDTRYIFDNHRSVSGGKRFKLNTAPVLTPDVELPVDPYVLGYWLGDGSKANGSFAIGDLDLGASVANLADCLLPYEEIRVGAGTGCNVAYIGRRKGFCPKGHEKSGDNLYVTSQGHPGCRACQRQAQRPIEDRDPILPSLMERLRSIGVLGNKHVPEAYLAAGTDQRLALLQGLLDSDGACSKSGIVGFTNKNRRLIDACVELARSLGYKPFVHAADNGAWVVHFKTTGEHRLFRLDRKNDRQVARGSEFRWIVNVEKVDSVPVKCIGIDTDSHLFQVEGGLLTHNTQNTFELFPRLVSDAMKAEYQIEMGAELIRANGGRARLQAVTSSYRALEGGRITFTLCNETQHWVHGNQGDKMFETILSNATKGGNRVMSITNAYLPGEDSVGERQRNAYMDILEGRAPDIGMMYDSVEAHPATPLSPDGVRYAIPLLRGDSWWSDPEDVIAEVMRSDVAPARSRRMFYNQIVVDDDALYTEDQLDALVSDHDKLEAGDEIVLGFDGGRSRDGTALVAIRVKDGLVWPLLIDERPPEWPADVPWEVNRERVDGAVHQAFRAYKVSAFYADVNLWESYLSQWGSQYGATVKIRSNVSKDGNAFGWDMRGATKRVTFANELLIQTIIDGGLKFPAKRGLALSLRRHILNTRRRETTYGVSFDKESRRSPKKVDGYAALLLAHTALNDLRQKTKPEKVRSGRGWFI